VRWTTRSEAAKTLNANGRATRLPVPAKGPAVRTVVAIDMPALSRPEDYTRALISETVTGAEWGELTSSRQMWAPP